MFSLHEALARNESGFTEAAFRKGWKESEDRVIHLPEHEPEHFRLFFNFIYARAVFNTQDANSEIGGENDPEWIRLVNAWALGNYLQAGDFKDALVDAIIQKVQKTGQHVPQKMHERLYPKSTSGALIRRLIVDIAATRWTAEDVEGQQNGAAWSEFFHDLSTEMMQLNLCNWGFSASRTAGFDTDPCSYVIIKGESLPRA